MLPLPSTRTNEHDRYCCVTNKLIANLLSNRFGGSALVVYVSVVDRLVDEIRSHHLSEPLFVLLIFVMKADENLVSWCLVHVVYLTRLEVRKIFHTGNIGEQATVVAQYFSQVCKLTSELATNSRLSECSGERLLVPLCDKRTNDLV